MSAATKCYQWILRRIPFVESKIVLCYARPGDRNNASAGASTRKIFDSDGDHIGAQVQIGENSGIFDTLPNYKTYFQRCI